MSYNEIEVLGGAPVECYHFRMGEDCWLYTSADIPVTIEDETYLPVTIERDNIQSSEEMAALDVSMDRRLKLAEYFEFGTPPIPVIFSLFRFHRGDSQVVEIFRGEVAGCTQEGGMVRLSCASTSMKLERRLPRILAQKLCNHVLYDRNCGLDKDDFKIAGFVSAVNGLTITVTNASSRSDGYFDGGFVRITGTLARAFIQLHIGNQLTLLNMIPEVSVGASVEVFAGCDRSVTVCREKFDNLSNHMGFPFMPERNPFHGGLLY